MSAETLRPFRVHLANGRTQDCVLHPDGRMTMEAAGQTLVSLPSFEDMLDMNWADARIEWNPAPAEPDTTQPEPSQLGLPGGAE